MKPAPPPRPSPPDRESGIAVLLCVLGLAVIFTIAAAAARISTTEMEIAGNYRGLSRAFYAADGSAQAMVNELVELGQDLGRFPTDAELAGITPPPLASVELPTHDVVVDGPTVTEPLQSGYYQGLVAVTQPYEIDVVADTTDWPSGSSHVRLSVLFDIIPIFQFAIFYEEDLEIIPGPDMTLNGRVHGNADIYLASESTLTVDSAVTSAGDVFNRRKDDGTSPGTVEIRDAEGGFPDMDGLDSDSDDWYTEALDRWDGNVRSREHGIERLNLTVADPGQPRMIVEPGLDSDDADAQSTKMFYDADLRILNGRAYDRDGNAVDTVDPVSGEDALRSTIIYDQREQRHMLTTEVDMEKLGRSPAQPANGLVYVGNFEPADGLPGFDPGCASCWGPDAWNGYDEPWVGDTEFAVKLTNGAEIAAPTTVVSDNPAYIRGDFNTVDKKGVAVIADAVTVLSNDWGRAGVDPGDPDDDLGYSTASLSDRNASSTTVNAAVMLGNTATSQGNYNGGVENVLRFLESWSGDTLTYRGSIIDLWRSLHATGDWSYGSPVYHAPSRDWAFDTDFLDPANLPPFSPRVYTIRVSDWARE